MNLNTILCLMMYRSPIPPQPQQSGPGQQAAFNLPGGLGDQVNPVMASMAMQYGQEFAAKGSEEIKRNLDRYVSIGQLRYYFAVDNTYVGKKLGECYLLGD